MNKDSTFFSLFHFFCLCATFAIVIYWIYIYHLNEDLCTVEFKNFYDQEQDELPMLSICLKIPFSEEKLEKMQPTINANTYFQFLKGDQFDKRWLKIDYETILKDPNKFLAEDWITYRNGTCIPIHPNYNNDLGTFYRKGKLQSLVTSVSFFYEIYFFSCYELKMPRNKDLHTFYFRGNTSLFSTNVDPGDRDLLTLLHYPNQLLTSIKTMRHSWPNELLYKDPYIMRFKIQAMEVLKRRQKYRRPCNEKWIDYDKEILKSHINRIGCRPPYLNGTRIGIPCANADQLKRAMFFLRPDGYGSLPPCRSMEIIHYTYESTIFDPTKMHWAQKESFWIGVEFNVYQFKEIQQVR